jgi:hypothetical protein
MTPTEATTLLRNIASYIEGGASVRLCDARTLRQIAEWISKQDEATNASRERELSDLMRPMRVSGASWHV